MKRSTLFLAGLLAIGGAQAADGVTFGVGVDYSSGDYGTATTTEILSVPFSLRYASGNWTYKASLPWVGTKHRATGCCPLGTGAGRCHSA